MTEHETRIKDLRPIGSKNTLMCILCGCSGKRDLKKYNNCNAYKTEMKNKQDMINYVMGDKSM